MNNQVDEQFLNKIYEDFSREQHNLMSRLKSLTCDEMSNEIDISKQLRVINSINVSLMKLRNIKRKASQKDM